MATSSAFKSTTTKKPSPINNSSSSSSLRRSRSLSRISRPDTEPEYIKNVEKGKFVNTKRGGCSSTTTPFPEISLDDLAIDFFSSSSSDSKTVASKFVERKGRSLGRWADDTASSSSRRKERSVSRPRASDSSSSRGRNVVSSNRRRSLSVAPYHIISDSESEIDHSRNSSNRTSLKAPISGNNQRSSATKATASSTRRSVSRTRGDVVSSNSVSRGKHAISNAAGSHRRRSLSVARYQISDSESENSSNCANLKAPVSGNKQMTLASKATASSTRRIGRSRSHKDLSLLHDGYSSHSSILTDDEPKDTRTEKHGFEKIIWAVYSEKAEHAREVVANGGLYEAMRKELRYAVDEIRTELNQAIGRKQASLTSSDCLQSETSNGLRDFSGVREQYSPKLDRLEKSKQDFLTEMLLEEQQGQDVPKMVKELPNSRTSAAINRPSRARKRSGDRSRVSERLFEEAERYFEDFICNIEDTDISSFDGERSDGSSTLGGTVKGGYVTIREAETCKTPNGSTAHNAEMDGVILPWLQWETSHDGSLSGKNKAYTPVTPKALQWDAEKETVPLHDPGSNSISSHGSWNPDVFSSPLLDKREDTYKTKQVDKDSISRYDMDEYLKVGNNEELLFEMYRERNRISSGGLLLCSGFLC